MAAKGIGEDPAKYSCHSLRSGGVTSLLSAGAESTAIKLHGRWASNMFERYTRYTKTLGAKLVPLMAPPSRERAP
ncbi:hypothetical protein PHMEG_00027738 [Phytophthora megakarya]|uniref:Tyr recombinase domain-containing protein n=1 Tax=Phytophthora megakarya TaxID=4795 RepID=A0A225V749_9STRA|nr:hypothetical protein PHMEG_00027738 [Phytophthora megakarya]